MYHVSLSTTSSSSSQTKNKMINKSTSTSTSTYKLTSMSTFSPLRLITNQWLLGLFLSCHFASSINAFTFIPSSKTTSNHHHIPTPTTTSCSSRDEYEYNYDYSTLPSFFHPRMNKMKLCIGQKMRKRVITTKLFSNSGDDDNNSNPDNSSMEQNNDTSSKKGNWMRRLTKKSKTTKIAPDDEDNNNEDDTNRNKSRFFSAMSKALKRTSRKKDNDSEQEEQFELDPTFNSEISLAIEIRKQKALDTFEAGDEIPDVFLPQELLSSSASSSSTTSSPDEQLSFDLDKVVSALNDNIFYMEKQIQMAKMDQRKYTGEVIPGIQTEEEKRLSRLKRELETKRKNVILDAQKKKKELGLQSKANQEKARVADAKAKYLEKVEKMGGEKLKKELAAREKAIQEKSRMAAMYQAKLEKKEVDEDKEEGTDSEKGMGVGKNISKAVDGVVSGAQSALTNAWKTVRNGNDEWITVCPKTRISPGEVFPAVAGGVDLLVIGSKDGTKIHCIANTCPHLGTPLETGMIERRKCGNRSSRATSYSMSTEDDTKPMVNDGFEDCIVCPLHQTAFSLDTGEVNGDWCPYPPVLGKVMGTMKQQNKVPTFQMRTRGKNIEIKISSRIDFGS